MGNRKKESSRKRLDAFRALIYEASESELDEAIREEGEDPEAVYLRGRSAIEQALSQYRARSEEAAEEQTPAQHALKEGLGYLVRILREEKGLSVEELAERARVEVQEVMCAEVDSERLPDPRTLVQLEDYFGLERKTLILLSGAVSTTPPDFTETVERFAANAKGMHGLTRKEKKMVNEFVRFLAKEAKSRR